MFHHGSQLIWCCQSLCYVIPNVPVVAAGPGAAVEKILTGASPSVLGMGRSGMVERCSSERGFHWAARCGDVEDAVAKLPAKNKNCREFTLSGFPANFVCTHGGWSSPVLIASGSPKKYHCRAPTPLPEVRRPYSFHILLYQLLTFFPSFGSAYHNNIQGTSFNPEIRAQRYAPLLSFLSVVS